MQDLKVTMIQTSLYWEDNKRNLDHFSKILNRIEVETDLVVLPEMFNTAFTMNTEKCAETSNGNAFRWLTDQAKQKNCAFTASILTRENGNFFNRMYFVTPDGNHKYYDKKHLFRMGDEHLTMSAGNARTIIDYQGWKINLQICYDLRFPVFSKNNFKDGQYEYDALIYIANWPEVRKHAYFPLLKARAIENQAYVLWVNRMGKDANDIAFSGDTLMIDPYGKVQNRATEHREEIVHVKLLKEVLNDFREKFQVGLDWDRFSIKNDF